MTAEGEFPKEDGDILYGSEINLFKKNIIEVYTGGDFNSSITSIGSNENSYEMTAITAANLVGADYLSINITSESSNNGNGTTAGYSQIKIQSKEVGGSYVDILAYKTVNSATEGVVKTAYTLSYLHTLTTGEKSNGIQIKIFSNSYAPGANSNGLSNIQTIIYPQ